MTAEDIELLRCHGDKLVRVTTTDGEEMVVKNIWLQDEYRDFICEIVSTNRENTYKTPLNSASYVIPYDVVNSFALVSEVN